VALPTSIGTHRTSPKRACLQLNIPPKKQIERQKAIALKNTQVQRRIDHEETKPQLEEENSRTTEQCSRS
jgi:hypothetical protein